MSYGKMNGFLTIIDKTLGTDDEGFKTSTEKVIAQVRCYREPRHGSIRWANLAAFSEATDMFRFRTIPGAVITTDNILECNGERFIPLSVEDVKGRGMYIEVYAKRLVGTQNG